MEYNIYKIHFKGKEYLIFSFEGMAVSPQFNDDVNKKLAEVFKEDSDSILVFPTKINLYGFKNIKEKSKEVNNE